MIDACCARERVVARAAEDPVVGGSTEELVGAATAEDAVAAPAPADDVRSAAAGHHVGALRPTQMVRVLAADEAVRGCRIRADRQDEDEGDDRDGLHRRAAFRTVEGWRNIES